MLLGIFAHKRASRPRPVAESFSGHTRRRTLPPCLFQTVNGVWASNSLFTRPALK